MIVMTVHQIQSSSLEPSQMSKLNHGTVGGQRCSSAVL